VGPFAFGLAPLQVGSVDRLHRGASSFVADISTLEPIVDEDTDVRATNRRDF
jgi:hypothetical protein